MRGGALDLAPEDDHFDPRRGSGVPGACILDERRSRDSTPDVCDGMAHLQRAGNISDAISGAITLADIRITQGRLREAMQHLRAGIAAGDRAEARQRCAERQTCMWE